MHQFIRQVGPITYDFEDSEPVNKVGDGVYKMYHNDNPSKPELGYKRIIDWDTAHEFVLTTGIPVVREVQVNQIAVESVKLTAHRVCLKIKRLINISYAN